MADMTPPLRALLRLALLTCFCLFASEVAPAQTEVTAGVRGTVLAEGTGLPVAGARVVLRNAALRVEREATTDAEGNYTIAGLAPGEQYEVAVSAQDFRAATRGQLTLLSGGYADVSLELKLVGLAETETCCCGALA
jgi:hypothetical protein